MKYVLIGALCLTSGASALSLRKDKQKIAELERDLKTEKAETDKFVNIAVDATMYLKLCESALDKQNGRD